MALTGFWGPVTSTVNWCEADYAMTPWVAELWNTVSSLAMVAAGLAGLWLYRRALERRFLAAFALLVLVGLGSVAFHATLRFELQLADELPMVYLVILIVGILAGDRPRRWLVPVLVTWAAVLTYLDAFTTGAVQFWGFQVGFGSLELGSLLLVFLRHGATRDPGARRFFRLGMSCYLAGILAWFVDIRFCPPLELHAVWHVLVSVGFYLLLLTIALQRAERLGRPLAAVSG